MSPAGRNNRRRKRNRGSLLAWWPLAIALAATPFAVRAASVLALSGPAALRLLYPSLAMLQAHPHAALTPEQQDALATALLWTQFPVYGLIVSLFARRGRTVGGLIAVMLLHALLWGAVMLRL